MSTRVNTGERPRTLLGYCWPWTVRPGEKVDFMVSVLESTPCYSVDLVRLVCTEALTDEKMFKVRKVDGAFSGEYVGRNQPIHLGSFVEIAANEAMNELQSFTVQVMVMPTFLPEGNRRRVGGSHFSTEEAEFQDQHVVSRWNNQRSEGWALIIDKHGYPAFITGDGESVRRTTVNKALIQDRWFSFVASFEADTAAVSIFVSQVSMFLEDNVAWTRQHLATQHLHKYPLVQRGPLRFAACTDGPGMAARLKPAFCFNGRLDRVRLSAGVLDEAEASSLSVSKPPSDPLMPLVGFWDFGEGIELTKVHDLSSCQSHGIVVNTPTRGVAGVGWNHSISDWRQCRDHYSAIHFHDDDLYDAEWKVDFDYIVPRELPSGVYAARIFHGDFVEYIPFFVAPPRGGATAPIALLLPTATYTAYSNIPTITSHMKRPKRHREMDGRMEIVEEDLCSGILQAESHAEFLTKHYRSMGKGIYSNHTDGTLCAFSSAKHPNLTIKPNGVQWALSADTLIIDWLENKGFSFDIITDELLHSEGFDLLSKYKSILTGNHPEYYSRSMLDAIEKYEGAGGCLLYLGGNGFFWVTSFHSELPGSMEVRKDSFYSGRLKPYELRHSFDGIHGGLWENNGRPPHLLVGTGLDGVTGFIFTKGGGYRRLKDSYTTRAAFIFEGVESECFGDFGVLGDGAAGQELDSVCAELGTPPHALHLARSEKFSSYVSMFEEKYELNAPAPFGDVVYFETPRGGAVFSVGSMTWVGSLCIDNYNNDISRITENVLRNFLCRG